MHRNSVSKRLLAELSRTRRDILSGMCVGTFWSLTWNVLPVAYVIDNNHLYSPNMVDK